MSQEPITLIWRSNQVNCNGMDGDLVRHISAQDVREIITSTTPEELEFPIPSTGHSDHVVWLALKGYTRIAADHLLHKEMVGRLEETVGRIIRALDIEFNNSVMKLARGEDQKRQVLTLARAYDLLLQIALNLFGLESRKIIGFPEEEIERTLDLIRNALESWEMAERRGAFRGESGKAPIAKFVVEENLSEIKKVMSEYYREPGSMLSYLAENIEKEIDDKSVLLSFLDGARKQIQDNLYYKMMEKDLCKFGNDYALGLRWLRHLGYVQVSTNPSLAAIAYEDEPSLWEGYGAKQFGVENLCMDLKSISMEHPEWRSNPEKHGDEIAAYGTEVAIWPNLAVFRPIAIASDMFHGMISLQLNPNIADDYERSVRDAFKIYSDAERFLKKYDQYLLWGYSTHIERGRPNIVFKVAGSSPAAIDITTVLESHGIGTNNTVTFTVSQEVRLILAKIEGRAQAIKKGILPTTVYETNMGGRLDDHIRECKAESLLKRALERMEDRERALEELAEKLGALEDVKRAASMDEKIRVVCHRRYLRPMNKAPFIDFLARAKILGDSREDVAKHLYELERSIGYGGICVTKRVYEIFFTPQNRPKWLAYIQSKYGLTKDQAEKVLKGIHVLPASKRKPAETLETMASEHMVHTEFPNHQKNVLMRSKEPDFKMEEYRNSVMKPPDQELLTTLLNDEDVGEIFRGAWELTPYLVERLKEAGIVDAEKYGTGGLRPSEWAELGSTKKTMTEFSKSYERFKRNCIDHVRGWLEET